MDSLIDFEREHVYSPGLDLDLFARDQCCCNGRAVRNIGRAVIKWSRSYFGLVAQLESFGRAVKNYWSRGSIWSRSYNICCTCKNFNKILYCYRYGPYICVFGIQCGVEKLEQLLGIDWKWFDKGLHD